MSFSINTNVSSLQAQQYLRVTSDFQQKTINRVTSGLRIVSSGDDAAGLAIANGYRSDSSVLSQGVRNANDGMSQLQIIDGGLNNISQLLDRARTLATQSATGTFTGDRGVLNSEFTNVISEINRQAQAVGLDSGGIFAKNLSVFIGGGKTSGSVDAIVNGSVSVNLTTSTVDARSLGLQGVQAAGAANTDIGTGSALTSVSSILGNTNNIQSESNTGYTDFYFQGPGFADSSKIKVSVNLAGVTDVDTLATAINAAIEGAGNGGSQAATAFLNAGIKANVVTDANGAKRLAFASSQAAFQVEAGDKTSNALLGNFKVGSEPEGADLSTTVTGANATASGVTTFGAVGAGNIVVRFSGAGVTSPVDVTLAVTAGTTVNQALTSLTSLVANNATLKGAGISVTTATAGSQLVFTGTHAEKFKVDVTGDIQNRLGLGSFLAGNSAQFDYASLTASADYSTAAAGTQTFQISFNGNASNSNAIGVDLGLGDATAATVTGGALSGTLSLNATNNQVNLTVDGTSYNVTLTPSANATAASIANQINTVITAHGSATVDSSNHIVIKSANKGTYGTVQIEAGSANTLLGLSAGLTKGVSRSGADIANYLNQVFTTDAAYQAAGLQADFGVTTANRLTIASTNNTNFRVDSIATAQAATVTGSATFTTPASAGTVTGNNTTPLAITVGTNDTLRVKVDGGAYQVIKLGGGAARTQAQVIADINSQLTGAIASADGSGNLQILSSTTGGSSTVQLDTNGNGSTANATLGFAAGGVTGTGAAAGTTLAVVTGTNDKLSISVDGGTAQVFTLTGGGTETAAQVVLDLQGANGNTALTGATASVDSTGHIKIVSATTGSASAITFNSISNNAYTTIGFTSGSTTSGNVAQTGFGVSGVSFTGNTASALTTSAAQVDSGGATQTTALAFSPILYGGDSQTISLSATDASGVTNSQDIVLRNDATARTGRSIDEALHAINTALQQSNKPTLQNIVAVKDNDGGAEKIRFISTDPSFRVSIGTNGSASGFGSQGSTIAAGVVGDGSTADISSQSSAQNAVTALANAVSTLGKSQAVVGRGQNQFNYAVNLAQSQLSNLAAAESRIRDADLASEAANLTKAQILLQAGIAALAQANSAPQQVLTLLRG